MLDMWERWIQFHELNLKRDPEEAPPIKLEKIIPLLTDRWKGGNSVKLINNETAALRISDIKTYPKSKATVLLIQYTDKNVTDPVFSHLETGTLRTEPKLDGEGVAVSAHVVLGHEPLNGNPESYRLLLEEVPGLGRSRLSPFLKSELKAASTNEFEFNDEESGKLKKCSPVAEILGDLSGQLSDDLKDGSILQGIELIKHTRGKSGFDEENFFVEVSRHIKITPVLNSGDGIIGLLKKVGILAKKDGYDDIKIRYKLPQGKQKTATMGATKEDIADTLIVKDEQIKSDEVLGQCREKISDNFAKKMIDLL
jgi:hypothetical protein